LDVPIRGESNNKLIIIVYGVKYQNIYRVYTFLLIIINGETLKKTLHVLRSRNYCTIEFADQLRRTNDG